MFSFFERISSHSQLQTNMSSAWGNKETEYSWWYSYHQCLWCLECSRRFLLETERLSENDRYNREINSKNPNTKNKRGILAFISQMSSPQWKHKPQRASISWFRFTFISFNIIIFFQVTQAGCVPFQRISKPPCCRIVSWLFPVKIQILEGKGCLSIGLKYGQ